MNWDDLEPLWVSGLALVCVLAGRLLFGSILSLQGEASEWALYLALGTLFPALILALSLRRSARTPQRPPAQALRLVLAALFVALSVYFLLRNLRFYLVILSFAQLIVVASYLYHEQRRESLALPRLYLYLLVITISWLAAVRLPWWGPDYDAWIFGSNYSFIVFVMSFLLSTSFVFGQIPASRLWNTLFSSTGSVALNLAAILLIGMASLRTDAFVVYPEWFSHWAVIVGPAELVRQGGWLLWDVPSQYGFLSTLSIAFFPGRDAWQALFIINAVTLFLVCCFIFFLFRSLRAGWDNYAFSLIVAITSVFLIAGWTPNVFGPQTLPSTGAFRYIWCFSLLGLLLMEMNTDDASRWHSRILLAGCLTWLIGTLWSAESAAYSAAIWLPSYALIIIRQGAHAYTGRHCLRRTVYRALSKLMVPPIMLAVAVAGIALFYVARLGQPPDLRGYVDYASTGFFALPMDYTGAVISLFLVFCAISTLAAYILRRGVTHRMLPFVTGTWAALWVTSSYFVARSHPAAVTNLSPIIFSVIGVMLYVLNREKIAPAWTNIVRIPLVPLMAVLLTLPLANRPAIANYITASQTGYRGRLELPVLDNATLQLFLAAGVKPTDPLAYLNNDLRAWPVRRADGTRGAAPTTRAWLPVMPLNLLVPLPAERAGVYVSRFIERRRLSGWLVQCKGMPYTAVGWLADELVQRYEPTRMIEKGELQLVWFEYTGRAGQAAPAVQTLPADTNPADRGFCGPPASPRASAAPPFRPAGRRG